MGALSLRLYEEPVVHVGLTADEIIAFAQNIIFDYFRDKKFHCGGPIPERMLQSPKRINLVLDCTFERALDIAYAALEEELSSEDHMLIAHGGVSPDIKVVVSIMDDLAYQGVPQELSSGLLVLFLELCAGVNVVY